MEGADALDPAESTRSSLADRVRSARVFSYAVIEQATFSAASFVIVLVLARWLTPTEFGVFSSFYAAFLLIQNVFDAIVIEPLAIFGASAYACSFRQYLARILAGHIAVSGAVLFLVGVAYTVLSATGFLSANSDLLALAVATPLLLLRWLVRQPCYVLERAEWSILANGAFALLAVGSFWLLERSGVLSAPAALLSLGVVAGLSSSLVVVIWLKPRWQGAAHPIGLRTLMTEHWAYGRWAIADKVLAWVSTQLVLVLLPVFSSFAAAGALRALTTLLTPAYMTMMAITGLLLPRFARRQVSPDRHQVWGQMRRILAVAVSAMVVYGIAIVLLGRELMSLLYAGKYDEYGSLPLLVLLSLGPVLGAATSVVEVVLRAQQRVRLMFVSKILPAILATVVGIPLMIGYGVTGALGVSVFGGALTLLALAQAARRLEKQEGRRKAWHLRSSA